MIKLSELVEARKRMSGGDWEVQYDRNDQANIYATNQPPEAPTEWIAILPHQCVKSIEEQQDLNATGIVATHNAADVLIEIARAALTLQDATIAGMNARMNARTEGNQSALADAIDKEIEAAEAYNAALAKVTL